MSRKSPIIQAAAGVAVLFFAGMVYAWSVMSGPISIQFPEWSKASLSFTFTLVMIFFCLGGLVGGFVIGRLGSRTMLMISGAVCLAGMLLASYVSSVQLLWLCFGVLCGFSSGFSYNAVMSTVVKWFPGKRGMIMGILLMGYGISSFVIGKVYQSWTAASPELWRGAFRTIGIASAAVMIAAAFIIRPPQDELTPSGANNSSAAASDDRTTGQMLKTPLFWLAYVWAVLLTASGIALVSQASAIAAEADRTMSGARIATVVGLISIFNGIARMLFGSLYDRFGRKVVMQTVNVLYVLTAIVLGITLKSGSQTLLIIGFILCGLGYGGIPTANSAFVGSSFGMKHYPMNLSMINTNLLIASFGSTVAGALFDASGSYATTFVMIAVFAVIGIVISVGMSFAEKK